MLGRKSMSSETAPAHLGPLSGVRVIDFSIMMAGPYCTRFLADMGAEIIKVETPDGDHIRNLEPLRAGRSAYFGHMNCGKRSVVLDLKKPAAVEAAKGLVSKADIVVENFRPGVAARLGVDYVAVARANPGSARPVLPPIAPPSRRWCRPRAATT